LGLLKPNGSIRPIAIGESLRRLVGKVLVEAKLEATERHFAPARSHLSTDPPHPNPVEAAQLGVGIKGGLEELVHAVSVALQSHPVGGATEGWNSISRPAIFRALLNHPEFADLFPFLSKIYSTPPPRPIVGRSWWWPGVG